MRANQFKYYLVFYTITLLLILFCFGGVIAISQILPFKNYTTKDGLVSNNVRALYQDSKGYLWIGTIDGLNVYDGYSFKLYTTKDGLPSNAIRCFLESKYTPGLMWIGTNEGVSRLYKGKYKNFRMGKFVHSSFVNALFEDIDSTLWCGTDRGIYRIRADTVETFVPDTSDFSCQSILQLNNDSILFGCNLCLYLYNRSEISFRKIDIGYTHNPLVSGMLLLGENDTTLWIATNDSTLRKVVNLHVVQKWKIPFIILKFLIKGDTDNLWLGSADGLFEIERRNSSNPNIIRYDTKNGLLGENIGAGLIDKENNLWLCVFNKALCKLEYRNIYRFPYKFSSYLIMGEYRLVIDGNNHFWVL